MAAHEVASDVVHKELRTKENTLSFWLTATSPARPAWEDAALAIVGGLTTVEAIDIAWLPRSAMERNGVQFEPSDGRTRILRLKSNHFDAVLLDAHRLAFVATELAAAIRDRGHVRRLTRAELLELLSQAVDDGHVGLTSLPKQIQGQLNEHRRKHDG